MGSDAIEGRCINKYGTNHLSRKTLVNKNHERAKTYPTQIANHSTARENEIVSSHACSASHVMNGFTVNRIGNSEMEPNKFKHDLMYLHASMPTIYTISTSSLESKDISLP